MSDFALRRESCEEILDYDVLTTQFENRSEQRRLKNVAKVLGFRIKTPILTYTQLQTWRNFFISKYGSLLSFTFTSPFDQVEYTVRMNAPISFSYQGGVFQGQVEFYVLS